MQFTNTLEIYEASLQMRYILSRHILSCLWYEFIGELQGVS